MIRKTSGLPAGMGARRFEIDTASGQALAMVTVVSPDCPTYFSRVVAVSTVVSSSMAIRMFFSAAVRGCALVS